MAILVGAAFYPQTVNAEAFTGKAFLEWSNDSQGFYLRTSVGIVGLLVRRNHKSQGNCIDRWYFADEFKAQREITDVMRKYPKYHPQGVILSVIEKKCGSTIYTKR